MVVLLLGASGFLGRHIAAALIEGGHAVIRAARRPPPRTSSPSERWIALDLMDERSPAEWSKLLAGVDATINGIGILRETRVQTFERIHVQGPQALFAACAAAGVRVIQISALGADACSPIAYLRSKGAADAHLLRTVERGVVVRPSLVFGVGGASARLFTRLAALPILPLPHQGAQLVQPIHVEDLAALIRTIAECDAPAQRIVSAVGPRPLTLKELLATLRAQMGLPPAWTIANPTPS